MVGIKGGRLELFKLYDYQQKMIDDARKLMRSGIKNIAMIAPPGAGKSVVIAEIARMTTNNGKRVLFFVHRQELVDQIKESLIQQNVSPKLSSVMMVGKVKNHINDLPKPDLIITDEAQHARAKTYIDIFKHWPDVPRLGFSGSLWRMSGDGFDDIYQGIVYGPSVKWLIDHKHLAPFTYYGAKLFDEKKLKKAHGDFTKASIKEAATDTIFGDVYDTWHDKASDRRTIVYAYSTEHSKEIAAEFIKHGVKAAHVDSKTPKAERDRIVAAFRTGAIQVLCNFALFDEGYNVKECSCCVIVRPTASMVFNIQSTMRCMRYLPGKQAIIIDHAGNYMRFGLPDDDREWSLTGKKRKNDVDAPDIHTCEACYQVFYDWKDNCCPYCGAPKPAPDPRTEQGKKEIEEAEMIEIAKRVITGEDGLIELYNKFRARKVTNTGNVRRPINAAIRRRVVANGGYISSSELHAFARELGKKLPYIYRLYKMAGGK